ncbi:GDSL-type esterase/lipase family protein [Kitasatospora sp. NBC_00070]|uniref:GDSL-type esterase/lipase family protein n=1 Tax=Kitasatospora sp. NBC_00070 TaxID=2975962 RepID=UPI0032552FA4
MRTPAIRAGALLAGLVLALGGAVPALAAPAPPAALAPPTGPTVAVALGDSFISGEGGRWLGNSARYQTDRNGTDRAWTGSGYDPARVYGSTAAAEGCHRSDVSELLTATLSVAERVNLACSGAETRHVLSTAAGGVQLNGEAPQLDRLGQLARTKRVSLVVLSLGGNDIGFGEIIGECAYDWAFSRLCSREQGAIVDRKLPQVRAAIGTVVDDLRATMTAAGYRTGDYRLVLQSYPSPIPGGEEFRLREGDSNRLNRDGCPFNNRDADWARYTLVPQLSDLVGSVAAAKGADFLDLQDTLAGHEVCSLGTSQVGQGGPDPRKHEWARFLDYANTQGTLEESMHPNAYGQRALGTCLGLIAARPGRWTCVPDYLGDDTPTAMRLLPVSS